jgi:ubiquinone/menaquinone biosynthesis C-methylase UbiE
VNQGDYEYRGLIAQSWDLLRGDTSDWPDRRFYRVVIDSSGQPVLDVGCGTGRLLLDYLLDNIDVEGVDNSPEMLHACRQKAEAIGLSPSLYLQAMEAMDLPRRYRTILVPSSSFQLLTEISVAAMAMRRFYFHLIPGGTLVMPFIIPGVRPRSQEWRVMAERTRPEDGSTVRRWSRSQFDMERQTESTEDRYEILRDGRVVLTEHHSRSPATRWYTQTEALELFSAAGFTQLRITRGFTFEPATHADELFSVFGTRP